MDVRVKILIELREKFSAIRDVMERAATYESGVPELEDDYNELYSSIAKDIETLEDEGVTLINYNPHTSLNEFYMTVKGRFRRYDERREYIASLYLKTDAKINTILEKIDDSIELKSFIKVKFLDIELVYDNYYLDLINLINESYSLELFPVIPSLIRKILENLVIDILRKKYGMPNVALFYNPAEGRFQNFSKLLENLENNLPDFSTTSLDQNLINKINEFRVQGNSHSHTLELNYGRTQIELDDSKDDLNDLIKKLIRIHNTIT